MNDQVIDLSLGSTLPTIVVGLQSEEGVAINLTTASSVTLRLTNQRTGAVISKSATVSDATGGVVTVEVTSDLTTDPGEWLTRFRVAFASGRTVDVPNSGYLRIRVS